VLDPLYFEGFSLFWYGGFLEKGAVLLGLLLILLYLNVQNRSFSAVSLLLFVQQSSCIVIPLLQNNILPRY
jgi:hypothetical protein